ncbi:hypothetical protein WJX81_006910 [Elliptochloris bilobata]|uniref:Uncharacterized protein n=1 Tax=Elliptochloris bilobata TaxID=381761 RepID=A0AAW1QWB0_9CHLO
MAPPQRLQRALTDCTQPLGSTLEGSSLQTVQDYLATPDLVYQAILDKASTEPVNAATAGKCITLLERYLPRYPASREMLLRIDAFCEQAGVSLASHPRMIKSLQFLRLLVACLGPARPPEDAAAKPHQDGMLGGLHTRGSASEPPAGAAGLAPGLSPARTYSAPSPALDAQRPESGGAEGEAGAWRSTGGEGAAPSGGGDAGGGADTGPWVLEEAGVASWAVPHDMLALRWRGDLPWQRGGAPLTEFQPSLALDHPMESAAAALDPAAAAELRAALRDVVATQRAQQASSRGAAPLPRPRLRNSRPRLLFHPQPLAEAEPLDMGADEVATCLDALCWDAPEGPAREALAGGSGGSARQLCASALVRLVADLWLSAGPSAAFPLALLLLRRILGNEKAAVRARAFDLVYNLAVHGELLFRPPSSHPAPPAVADGNLAADTEVCREGDAGLCVNRTKSSAADEETERFRQWLRLLLFELLLLLAQRREDAEDVWQSALGALMHLTTAAGRPVAAWAAGLPAAAAAELLRCAERFRWGEQRCLLAVLLDSLLAPAASGGAFDPPLSAEAAAALGALLTTDTAADALCGALQGGAPYFGRPLADALSRPELQPLAALTLEQAAASEPKSMRILAAASADDGVGAAWLALQALLGAADAGDGAAAEARLLALLRASIERELAEHATDEEPEDSPARRRLSLLPALADAAGGATARAELARLLRHALAHAAPRANSALRLVRAVRRLLLYAKRQAALESAAALDLGDDEDGDPSPIPTPPLAPEAAERPDPAGARSGSLQASEAAERAQSEAQEAQNPRRIQPGVWAARDVDGMAIATLATTVSWLLDVAPPARFEAMLETAELLLALLLAHPAPSAAAAADSSPASSIPDPSQGLGGCSAGLSATATAAAAFLAGGAAAPVALLARVPPALLARLVRGLSPPIDTPISPGWAADAADARAAVTALAAARCRGDARALAAAGGEAAFAVLLGDAEARVRLRAAAFLRARLTARPAAHGRALRGLLAAAQAAGDERLLRNAYLALSTMMAADRSLFGAPVP